MKLYLALILLFPLAGALINALAGSRLPRRAGESIACGVIWCSFACSVLAMLRFSGPADIQYGTWLASFDFQAPIAFRLDQLSLALTLMITFVCGLIHLYSTGYMRDEPDHARYFALLNIFVFAMLVLILAANLPLLYLGWEGVGFCSYALIGFWYREEKNATAGRKAFIVTRIGDTAFGIAIVWMFLLFGTTGIAQLNGMGALVPADVVTALGILILIGAAGKSAQLPLSVWLPDAMAGPTPVSAQIHAATMVTAGVYLLMRLFPLIGASEAVRTAIAACGGATAFYAASCACAQRDLKRILAYSTISQIGYMVLGVGAGALTAATFHLLTHAFFKALLFLGAGCVITSLHHQQDIFRMEGLRTRLPAVYWPFLAGALCLAGFPGSGGFFSKDAILGAVLAHGGPFYNGLFAVGLLTALLTAFYTFRMLLVVFHGEASPPPFEKGGPGGISPSTTDQIPLVPPLPKREAFKNLPASMTQTLIPLAILGLCGGVLNLPEYLGQGLLTDFLGAVPSLATTEHASPAAEITLQGVATLVCLAGLGLARMRYMGTGRKAVLAREEAGSGLTGFLLNGWYLDRLYRLLLIDPFTRLGRFLWKVVDQGAIDGTLDGVARSIMGLGSLPARWNSGRVATALFGLAGGAGALLAYIAWVMS